MRSLFRCMKIIKCITITAPGTEHSFQFIFCCMIINTAIVSAKMDESGHKWIYTTASSSRNLESRAVLAGYECDDHSPIYVGRAYFQGDLMPCKVVPMHNVAYVSYDMREISVDTFEMYCRTAAKIEWISASDGHVPADAVEVGKTANGETLYMGRVHHEGSLTPGKVHPSHGCCYIPYDGAEISHRRYEVMVHVYE